MGKLIAELRRRNVFRVAGVYAVVGWLPIQVGTPAATLIDALLASLGDDEGAASWFDEAYGRREHFDPARHLFKLPEQWGDRPLVAAALDKPELAALFEIRRKSPAAQEARP